MKFVYVLEDDPRFLKEIVEAIRFIEPKIQIRLFPKLDSFVEWLRLMMTEGAPAIAKGGLVPDGITQEPLVEEEHQLVLVISKIEFLGVKQLNLLRKTRDLFIERKICTKEDPTAIVLTAFDDPNFEIKDLEDRILNNIIFKPFDRLILIQHLTFAIDGRHPASKYTIQNQKTTALIEMLKDAPMEAVTEIGFFTRSNRAIESGKIAKYYGPPFLTDKHRSMIGVSEECKPHPSAPQEFQVFVRFFAADPTQVSNLRKSVRAPKAVEMHHNFNQPTKKMEQLNIVIIDQEEVGSSGIGATLERRFKGLKVTNYDSFKSFILDLDPTQMNSKDETLAKCFSASADMTFLLDPNGGTIFGFEKAANAKPGEVFGLPEKDLINKSNWPISHLDDKHVEKYKKLVRKGNFEKDDDPFFLWKVNGGQFLTKFVSHNKKQNGHVLLKLVEGTKADWVTFLQKNSKFPSRVDAIFLSHHFLSDRPAERWAWVQDIAQKRGAVRPFLFLLAVKDYSDEQERVMATYLSDIFFKPVDRSYLVAKFHHFFPHIEITGEKLEVKTVLRTELLKVANPVKVTEMSEAGLVMQYYRPINIGSFREMVLWQPYEIGAPELLATCNYTEPVTGVKDLHSCHFVFFGATDHFLKAIRVWIRDNYVLSKEGS